jgi:hypothetical protein
VSEAKFLSELCRLILNLPYFLLAAHYTCRSDQVSAQYKARYLESFEKWCSRRMEKISETDRVRNN